MDNFNFYSPTFFAFGKDREQDVGALVKRFGGTKVLIHYGGGSVVRSGLLSRVKASLDAEGIPHIELGGVKPNPRSGLVYEGIDLCRREGVNFILAVGGGSTIDSSKAIAAGVVYDGDFWDFYCGKYIDKALPVGTILTIAAAGSEGSPDSVITNENGMFKRGATGDAIRPKFSILNPALTQTLPPYQTACGITDIMAHLYERYLTNTKEVEVTDRLIEALLLTMIHEGTRVIENPDNYEARANIMWAGMMAHNNSVGVGRSQDWTSHDIEHELSALYDCACDASRRDALCKGRRARLGVPDGFRPPRGYREGGYRGPAAVLHLHRHAEELRRTGCEGGGYSKAGGIPVPRQRSQGQPDRVHHPEREGLRKHIPADAVADNGGFCIDMI